MISCNISLQTILYEVNQFQHKLCKQLCIFFSPVGSYCMEEGGFRDQDINVGFVLDLTYPILIG